jgi:hypothetical protein
LLNLSVAHENFILATKYLYASSKISPGALIVSENLIFPKYLQDVLNSLASPSLLWVEVLA